MNDAEKRYNDDISRKRVAIVKISELRRGIISNNKGVREGR